MRSSRALLRFLVALAWASAAAASATAAELAEGKLKNVVGSVEVKKRDGGDVWVEAAEGMKVVPGDQITTGIDGRVFLIFKESQTEIHPLTQFIVGRCLEGSKENYTELFLQIGKVASEVSKRSAVPNKFNIITPTTVAGVRGTKMTISHLPGIGTNVNISDGRGYVSLVSAKTLPPAVLPLLGLKEAKKEEKEKEKAEKKEEKAKEKAERKAEREERKAEREAEREERKTEKESAEEKKSAEIGGEVTGAEATPAVAVEQFNDFLQMIDQSVAPEAAGVEPAALLDVATLDYVIPVADGQRVTIEAPVEGATTDLGSVVTPTKAMEQDAQTVIAPAGLSPAEVTATTTSVSSTDAPESIQVQTEQSTFSQVTESATATSTTLGGIPPSSTLVPPALPDRSKKSNLTN